MTRFKILKHIDKKFIEAIEDYPFEENEASVGTTLITFIMVIVMLSAFAVITVPYLILYIINLIYNGFEYVYFKTTWPQQKEKIIKMLDNYQHELIKSVPNGRLILVRDDQIWKEPEGVDFKGDPFNVQRFIRRFLIVFNYDHASYLDYGGIFNYGTQQCTSQRRRSLGDIFLICRYYYPDCTIHDVLKELVYLCENKYIGAQRCNDIHKFVFYKGTRTYRPQDMVEYSNLSFSQIIKIYED